MFRPVDASARFPALEAEVSAFWKERAIFEKSLAQRAGAKPFVFYEGPPTANGMPHPGHCLTRAIKDLYPRYRTMRGYYCERKAGWDTHGLPVEVEVCKELGIHSKEEIENYGIEPFIHKCQQSVWQYTQEWERLTDRIGFWVDLDAYVTYHQSYVESVWWALKNFFDRGLLYQGHKIVWWWAQGGTALSAGEVGQGYREVADPSVYVRFPLLDKSGTPDGTSLLVWTTTPWTLPSNQFAAVHPDLEYSIVRDAETGDKLIIASALVETIAAKVKRELIAEGTLTGKELLGRRYVPPFDYYYGHKTADGKSTRGSATGTLKAGGSEHLEWRIIGADFVTTDSGTGVVHQAPAFGEVDYDVLQAERARFADGVSPHLICAVGPDGKFTFEAREYEGRWVKEADRDITRELRARGLLFHQEQYLHEYPFCWRAEEDPLIQYPRRSWFVRTTQFRDQMLANNAKINWQPEHIRDGRFGNFLESNVDWALSRERYWGTPLPIWVCQSTGKMEAIASYDELLAKPGVSGTEVWDKAKAVNPDLNEHLRVHKPYIDAVTYTSPFDKNSHMRRVDEVIDCWFDSGAMPFAQWGYPHRGRQEFAKQFPADFISEAIDQTRGWFYSLLAISTMLFGDEKSTDGDRPATPLPHPYRNCVVLGLMLGEDGQKMSKSKRNYREPTEIFDRYGADALRWYFFANQPPWTSIRYSERAIKDSIPEFLLRLWNVYSFFVIYASIDGFDPADGISGQVGDLDSGAFAKSKTYRVPEERSELDRWILGELHRTTAAVIERMDNYDNYAACAKINEFVDALSNWYVRRSRSRFWEADKQSREKLDAYWTLYECLLATIRLAAPFVPFVTETMWQNLAVAAFSGRATESVHLTSYPTSDPALVDEQLSTRMGLVREISSLGRMVRASIKSKVRQPLAKVEVVLIDTSHQTWLSEHSELILEELNVKLLEFPPDPEKYISYTLVPDLKRLGQRLKGIYLPVVKQLLATGNQSELLKEMRSSRKITLKPDMVPTSLNDDIVLFEDDIQIRLQAKPGWGVAQGTACVVVLPIKPSDDLLPEGRARDLIHFIQTRRKELGCEYEGRIRVGFVADLSDLRIAASQFANFIKSETLASELRFEALPNVEKVEVKFDIGPAELYVEPLT